MAEELEGERGKERGIVKGRERERVNERHKERV